ERHAGGLTGTALVAARRMGRACHYAGTLGSDELSRFIVDGFAAEGVSTRHLVRRDGTHPFHSTILVDTQTRTRTILFDARNVVGADPQLPPEEVIRSARVLFVDHVGLPGMVRAARIARAAGIPVVADIERDVGELFPVFLGLVDHLILPFDFASKVSGATDAVGIVRALWTEGRKAVVVTRSEEGSWYTSADEPGTVFHQPAFIVDAVDTNGCGDVFHGVYAASLAEGMPMERRVRFAAAVAALKATHSGGQKGIPLRPEADGFFAEQEGRYPRSQA
ncbi:MAG TPA: PfkB family carbohydrate kinase, partial [Spirochaetia bacterium]